MILVLYATDYAHRHGLLSAMYHVALVPILATRQSIHEAVRMYGAPEDALDLPTALASDLTMLNSVYDVNRSSHAGISRHSADKELGGLLQAGTFVPAPA